MKSFALALGLSAAGWIGGAAAQVIPDQVFAIAYEMDTACASAGGVPGDRDGVLMMGDLDGDGIQDWVMDQVAYQCRGVTGLFSGSHGGEILVWAGLPDGHVSAPQYFSGFGARMAEGKAWIQLAGEWCEQDVSPDTARVDYIHCERAVVWTGSSWGLAPLSIRAFTRPANGSSVVQSTTPGPAEGATSAWLTGIWVQEGGQCDSGEPVAYRADGTLMSEFTQGRWRLDGDVLSTAYVVDDGYSPPSSGSARLRVERLAPDRMRTTNLAGNGSGEFQRCS